MNPTCAHTVIVPSPSNGHHCRDCGTPFVLARFAPLTPWSTLAAVVEERNRYYAEVAALRSQVEELMRCGVSIHKNARAAVDFECERVNEILTRMASDAHDRGDSAAADALAAAAIAVRP